MGECNTCKQKGTLCQERCPVCGSNGIFVPTVTVNSLLKATRVDDNLSFKLCTTPSCNVSYFSCNELFFELEEIIVPVWFKKEKQKYIVCYCRNITLQEIIKAVKELNGNKNLDQVLKHLNKNENNKLDCLHQNPTGVSCDKLMINAIEYAHKLYIEQL